MQKAALFLAAVTFALLTILAAFSLGHLWVAAGLGLFFFAAGHLDI